MQLEFHIPGPPCGKGRPRFFRGHAVTPEKTRSYEALVREMADAALRRMAVAPDFYASCRVRVLAYWPVPVSYVKGKREACARGAMALRPGKPDIDNVLKAVLDGMNGIVFADDGQVVRVCCEKRWAADDERPRTEVCVSWED